MTEYSIPNGLGGSDAERRVRDFMTRRNLHIRFDGSVQAGTGSRRGYGRDDVEAWVNRPLDWSFRNIVDELMLELRSERDGFGTGEIARAVRLIARVDQRARLDLIMRPLIYGKPDATEQAEASAAWTYLAEAIFAGDRALAIAVLQHFIWQVKQKRLERVVHHHLMPVIVSPEQGSGKTTFVQRFLEPLHELATDPVALSDLADRRSGDLLTFPVVFVDDVERLDPRLVATLKSLVSAEAVNRRRLGTSVAEKRPQKTTLIGTANQSVGVLIADPTGHRRFAELRFRNGAVATGGDEAVWRAVRETDYRLLWQSVDAFGPAPIQPYLVALAALQARTMPKDRLRDCLVGLDPLSEDVQNITTRSGVGADDLRFLICAKLGENISTNDFYDRMASLVSDAAVPFAARKRTKAKSFYPLKAAFDGRGADPTTPVEPEHAPSTSASPPPLPTPPAPSALPTPPACRHDR